MINNRKKGKLRLSLNKGEILGRTDNNNRPRRDYVEQTGSNNNQVVGAVFREPVHQVLEKVKNESFFKWPNKMVGNPEK